MKYWVLIALMILTTVGTALSGAVPTYAASTWLSTENVSVENTSSSFNVDYTLVVQDSTLLNALAVSNGVGCTSNEFDFAFSGGRIAVSQVNNYGGGGSFYGEKQIQILYNDVGPTPNGTTNVYSNYIAYPSDPQQKLARILYRSDVGLLITCNATSSGSYDPGLIATPSSSAVFYSTYPANYESGYDGEIVPDSPPTADVIVPYVPNFYVSNAVGYKVLIHDQNFNTFDGVPFTCSGGLAPVLFYEIWDRTSEEEVLLYEGSVSATAQIERDLINSNVQKNYRVIGWYSCGESPEIQFDQSNYFDFSISKNGTLMPPELFEVCLTGEPPFIDLNGCLNNLMDVVTLLTFNTFRFSNDWNLVTGCTNLNTLHIWLNLDNNEVCAYFSNTVRDIVTPFITLALGLTSITWIARRGDKEF